MLDISTRSMSLTTRLPPDILKKTKKMEMSCPYLELKILIQQQETKGVAVAVMVVAIHPDSLPPQV
jgi:hypothetical protein